MILFGYIGLARWRQIGLPASFTKVHGEAPDVKEIARIACWKDGMALPHHRRQ
jgi:hypothetical protein